MSNSQIVIASDRPPSELTLLESRLQSRFEWGLTTVMGKPSTETRMAILQTKASQLNLTLPSEVLSFLAEKFSSSVRELEGAVNRLSAYAELTGSGICLEVANTALADLLKRNLPSLVSPADVLSEISSYYGVSVEALSSKRRDKFLAKARQVGMFMLRELSQITLVEIGRLLGSRDHTSVRYSIASIETQILKDSVLHGEIESIRQSFKAA